jgi:RNA polymerase sigma factor (sigma-70 family)
MRGVMRDCGPDVELARRAAGGDGNAWREIYERTAHRLFAFLCYQIGNREEALDLVQEAYLTAFRRLSSYRGAAPLEAWLRAIALRKALDWKRTVLRRWKRMRVLKETAAVIDPSQGNVHFASERTALNNALARLSSAQRAVLLLREWEEWSFKEIGHALGCKESTARVHHTRAREKMRKLLQDSRISFSTDDREGQEA